MVMAGIDPQIQQALDQYKRLTPDEQLALLWYVYEEMGEAVTPAAPGAASEGIAEGLFAQVKALSFDEQLEAMRAMLNPQDTQLSREYGALSRDTKLAFWYRLAQGMSNGTIVPMPENYAKPEAANKVLLQLVTFSFEQQITFLREGVAPTGAEPKSGAAV
ncbi:MAG: Orange carotenoid protein [Leptolyngbya sp. SIO4C5]|uniref:orange carotenoid protein N-terminal domain-containing protein n=1 Tax=Sphaerothrix gracilis TaxID=3151835 RepID=UPI0013C14FF2|nr:Orange carotenoid protein [Leptolyngbya sp. SIO4C5]